MGLIEKIKDIFQGSGGETKQQESSQVQAPKYMTAAQANRAYEASKNTSTGKAPSTSGSSSGSAPRSNSPSTTAQESASEGKKTAADKMWDRGSKTSVSDRTLAKRKAEEAQKAVDDYVASDEYKQKSAEISKQYTNDLTMAQLLTGIADVPIPEIAEDEKLKELRASAEQAKAESDYYERQMQEEENQRITDENMKEIQSWSDEDRAALEEYIRAKDERDNPSTVTNPFLFYIRDKQASKPYSGLVEKYGEDRLEKLAESYGLVLHEQDAQKIVEDTTAAVDSVPGAIGHNVLGVGARAYGGVYGALGRYREAFERTGQYSTLEAYNPEDALSLYGNTVLSATSQNIAGDEYDENGNLVSDGGALRQGASYAYQGVMGAADSIARLFMGGGAVGGAALAATNTFSQTMSDASKQGATPAQAALLATVNAGVEAATEEIPLDDLFEIAKGGKQPLTQAIKNAFKQAAVEATTEEISLFAEMVTEAAILQEKSSDNQRVNELVAQGMSPEEAKETVSKEFLDEALQTAIVSGFSGGVSSAGASVAANVNTAPEVTQPAMTEEERARQNVFNTVKNQENAEVSAATPETAQQATQKVEIKFGPEAQPVSPEMEQTAQQPTVAATPVTTGAEQANSTLNDALGKFQKDGYISNTTAETILNDPAALERLQEQTGVELPGTKSGNRKAVKDMIQQIAGESTPTQISPEGRAASMTDMAQEAGERARGEDVQQTQSAQQGGEAVQPEQVPALPKTEEQAKRKRLQEITAFTNPVEANENSVNSESAPQVDTQSQSVEGGQQESAADFRQSNTFMNSGINNANENVRQGYRDNLKLDPDAAKYEVKHNADTLAGARDRVSDSNKVNAEYENLVAKDYWNAEDVATSTLLLDKIMASGDPDAAQKLDALRQKRKEIGVGAGQVSQAFNIQDKTMRDASSPATAVDAFRKSLEGMKESETTYSKKSGVDFETWKKNIQNEVDKIGIAIALVEDGDTSQMRDVIRQIARARKTTAMFGTSQKLTGSATRILNKLDFDTLKTIANTQVAAMADDYRHRSAGEVVSNIRKQNMLTSLKTFARNISGNGVGGLADSVSDSGAGRMVDAMLSKITGKRTVGNDFKYAKTYIDGAKDAAQFASLCVELNIPIETDVASSYDAATGKGENEKYVGRAFRATGNPAMRVLYAYQKYMSYALEVTDKIFEGGTNAAVSESLNNLKSSGLTDEDVDSLAEYTANRRTFKNATWETSEMVDGKEQKVKHGSNAARFVSSVKNIGADSKLGKVWNVYADYKMPFTNVPMNVAQTGIYYTAGIAKSVGEIISIIHDAKAGIDIPVERQRQAASDFGRGATGTVMIALFTSAAAMGALKATDDDDWNKEALAQAEGRSGAQINWSALQRGLNGESTKWQQGDTISSMDFLEPFNTQMYLGYELAQAEDMKELLKAYPQATIKSVWNSLIDSPVMTNLADTEELIKDISEAESADNKADAIAGYVGNEASSFIPQVVRQTAQNMDGYYRDTRGATAAESAWNSFKAAIPGQSQDLPIKYSGLGEAQKRGSAVETFADPTATKEYQPNPVTKYLDDLSEKTGDNSIYPERQAPMKIVVNDREIHLDGSMRETYQRTYGQKASTLYSGLIRNEDFADLPDDLKTEAFKTAESYAQQFAKAAVSEYRDIPKGTEEQIVKDIVANAVLKKVTDIFGDLNTAREYGYDDTELKSDLGSTYDVYDGLSDEAKNAIREEDSTKYIEAREEGLSQDKFLNVVKNAATAKGTGSIGEDGQPTQRDADKLKAIANTPGLTPSEKDVAMKLYMDDYDPNAKKVDTTELKYDYIRNEMDYSAYQYAVGYDIFSFEKAIAGEGTADRTRERMCRELHITMDEAKALYKILGGYWKPWEE